MPMQIRRTLVPNSPPTSLAEGQLGIEMASTPPKLWVGVPTTIDASGRRLIAPDAPADGTVYGREDNSWVQVPSLPDLDKVVLRSFVSRQLGTVVGDIPVAPAEVTLREIPVTGFTDVLLLGTAQVVFNQPQDNTVGVQVSVNVWDAAGTTSLAGGAVGTTMWVWGAAIGVPASPSVTLGGLDPSLTYLMRLQSTKLSTIGPIAINDVILTVLGWSAT